VIDGGAGTGSKPIGSTSPPAAFRCTMRPILNGNGVMMNATTQPTGELSLRTVAMPADTNPAGDIFGGWIMSLMDLAAGVSAGTRAKGRVATAAVSNLSFLQPVKVGDVVCVYTAIVRTGRSSMTLGVEAWVLRRGQGERVRVTAAEFVLVAVDDAGKPRRLPEEG
jgi:acyl-CoA thioesterase YciA